MVPSDRALATSYSLSMVHLQRFGRNIQWNVSRYKWPYLDNRWKIGLKLLLITNRKWHTSFKITWKSSTLDDWGSLTTTTIGYSSGSGASCFYFSLSFFLFFRATAATVVARLSYRNSVRLFVCLSVCPSVARYVYQSKTVQAMITKFSPSAAWKTLVYGTVKLFHRGHREQRR